MHSSECCHYVIVTASTTFMPKRVELFREYLLLLTFIFHSVARKTWQIGHNSIIKMYPPLMRQFQRTSVTSWPWKWPFLLNIHFGLSCHQGDQCFTNTCLVVLQFEESNNAMMAASELFNCLGDFYISISQNKSCCFAVWGVVQCYDGGLWAFRLPGGFLHIQSGFPTNPAGIWLQYYHNRTR